MRKLRFPDPEIIRQAEIDAAWTMYNMSNGSPHILHAVWLRDHIAKQNGRCYYCHIVMITTRDAANADRVATLDHVIPKSKGGSDTVENTVAACAACNSAKIKSG